MRSEENRRIKLYKGSWHVVWRESNGTKRVSLRTKDRGQAERNFQEFIRQQSGGGQTIDQIIAQWLEDKKHLKSIDIARNKFKPISAFFGNLNPNHITRDLCREYIKSRDVSNTTIRNEMAVLRAAINWVMPKNDAVFLMPEVDPPKDHYLTKKDYRKLLEACAAHHIWLFIITALHTGARSNAILELEWSQVDFERGVINLSKGNHKNKRRAIVPMSETLKKALQEAYKARTCDFVIEFAGNKIESIRKGFGQTAKRAKVEASPHVLRHTCAMALAESGVPLAEISQFLGHAGQTTTERVYARFSPDYLRNAANALNDWHIEALK